MGGQNLSFTLSDFMQDSGNNCVFMFTFINVNATGALQFNLEDMLLIGMQYFKRFTGLHFNFDDKKMALISPAKDVIHPSTVGSTSNSTLIVVGAVFGLCALVGIVAGVLVWRRKKLQSKLDAYDEL